MNDTLWPALMAAREAIAKLDGLGKLMPSYSLVLTPLQSREALRSSSMEGTYATPEQLLLYQAEPREPRSATDPANAWREVHNYGMALKTGQELLDSGYPLSTHLIRTLHRVLMSGVRGADKRPGEFRQSQVIVGSGGRYIPPPAHLLPDCLDAFETSLDSPNDIDALIWAFMVHYQFEAIHPFLDGNGRVGRLLLCLQIYKTLELSKPWLYLSPYFERHKDEYIDLLFRVSTHGDWYSWIAFCLEGARAQALDSIYRFEKLVALREEFFGSVQKLPNASARLYQIVDTLFERPVITVPSVAAQQNVTYPTAKSDIKKLIRCGILQTASNTRPHYFFAPRILDIAYADNP
ncbi:MAG: Fic family protein [Gammaproteobacteria bacterium]